ncbi:hypothetical protein Nepgr_028978 [Nepenthes gracilis]|uniref:Uncharacterized protein n=1 Tax=Nepenthes gracilis TaxID=150966 RepID=A0AAD3Y4F7_NEPGR|nr:hypothetical protein Nepgr_028978 [Nepenthes gracilis]
METFRHSVAVLMGSSQQLYAAAAAVGRRPFGEMKSKARAKGTKLAFFRSGLGKLKHGKRPAIWAPKFGNPVK